MANKYVEQNLGSGERIIHSTELHWIVLVPAGIFAVPLALVGLSALGSDPGIGIILLLMGILIFGLAWLSRASFEFVLTNKRVIYKRGVVSRKTHEMFLNKIESIGVDQGLFGRMFGYGSVRVRGTGGSWGPFKGIVQPLVFRSQVQEQTQNSHVPQAAAASV